jgi:hypothetical protein
MFVHSVFKFDSSLGVLMLHLIPAQFPSVWHTTSDNIQNLNPNHTQNMRFIIKYFLLKLLQTYETYFENKNSISRPFHVDFFVFCLPFLVSLSFERQKTCVALGYYVLNFIYNIFYKLYKQEKKHPYCYVLNELKVFNKKIILNF